MRSRVVANDVRELLLARPQIACAEPRERRYDAPAMTDTTLLSVAPRARFARRSVIALAMFGAFFSTQAFAQAKPSRPETLAYINNVLAKSTGFVLTHTDVGSPKITSLTMIYEAATKSYLVELTEELVNNSIPGQRMRGVTRLRRFGWNMNRLQGIEDVEGLVSYNGGTSTHPDLRRVKITFAPGSVRQHHIQHVYQNDRYHSERVLADGTIDFVTFFYRKAEPDDGKRLRNALLRLKELDAEEPDPFLK
jgi:hypothetical protein